MSMELRRLSKAFASTKVVDDVSLSIASGELAALLGPSGGGKSTILRIIAGLERPDAGEIWLDGRRADDLHPRDRRIGFVFQHYALFRHMTVADNIAFGLRVKDVRGRELSGRVAELVELMGLTGLEHRFPAQLSGGQRQRVALARALAPEPRLLLLDEPFAAIDAKVRQELRGWLRRLHERVGATTVLVTHDRDEAFALADRIILVHQGRVAQMGTPLELLDDPGSEFVADFLGEVNRFDATARAGALWVGPVRVPAPPPNGAAARVVVRAYDVRLWAESPGVAVIDRVIPLGDRLRVEATIDGGTPLFAQFPRRTSSLRDVVPGTRVAVEVTHARAWANE